MGSGDGIDALIDLVSYAPDDLPLTALRKGGTVASSLGAASDEALAADGLVGTNIMAMPTSDVISALAGQVLDGILKVDVETILPLASAADGLATIASGRARGKIVVQVGD
jgi:NADPH:quinone reductase